jgi:hypothetical protein
LACVCILAGLWFITLFGVWALEVIERWGIGPNDLTVRWRMSLLRLALGAALLCLGWLLIWQGLDLLEGQSIR